MYYALSRLNSISLHSYRLILCILFWAVFVNKSHAQLFKGGIVAGINFTQIDGDATAGYDKIGFHGGFISEIALSDHWLFSTELLYTQKGSASGLFANNGDRFKLYFNYAEIPLLIHYHDTRGGMTFGGGFSLGRLVGYKYTFNEIDNSDVFFAVQKAKRWDFDILAEIRYMFVPAFGLGFRAAYSLLKIRTDCISSAYRNCGQFNNSLTLRGIFLFSALRKQ